MPSSPVGYDTMQYARVGRSGIRLPRLSIGLWHNFGERHPVERQREVLLAAIDLGIVHFDLANNYGPPYGAAESAFGGHLRRDLAPLRDELVVSTKAGYDMWPGPYGDGGSRKYLLASLDQSLQRMGLDYVDVFYHHRPDPDTPVEETAGALAHAVRQGKALYVGISNYGPDETRRMAAALADDGVPLLIHQPEYSMLERTPEAGLLDVLDDLGVGAIVYSPLAQGLLTDRYLDGVPAGSRATHSRFLSAADVDDADLTRTRALHAIAAERGQTLAQLALQWVLRRPTVASAIVGASSADQLRANAAALDAPTLAADELERIDAALAGTLA